MTVRALCIHGHFYQPPREDPLTGEIPVEAGAAPYRNWNERILAECYRPNADLGNFGRISFNIGATLIDWMAGYDPATYQKIIQQDQRNMRELGVGNAMAQSYNHTILPLASRDDKVTQVKWGIADFRHRFGRMPKGMWLPETASNQETLEVLAENGIQFTILAPWQADTETLDSTQPYLVPLPGNKQITVFFYNQDLSTRVSFDPAATSNADLFLSGAVVPKFGPTYRPSETPQLLMIASDGELYGHHQKFRDKFLAHLMDGALTSSGLEHTFPELWLHQFPAKETMKVRENTSWSCHHGVTRWCGDCGCTPDSLWKEPMRVGLNKLGELIDCYYQQGIQPHIKNGLALRNDYIHVVLGERSLEDLIFSHAGRRLDEPTSWRIQMLLAAQYQRQRMFTSCGWFFDEFDRIEPRNNIAYAAQAVWLTGLAAQADLAGQAMDLLRPVRSQRTGQRADQVFAYYLSRAQSNLSGS